MCRFEFANEDFRKICNSLIDMIDRAQEALSCGLLPKTRQRTDFDHDTSGRTRAVMHFDSLAKEVGMFVGRKDLLEQMRGKLLSSDNSDRKRMLYLLGMGGVGKTQVDNLNFED